jgi:ABC-2 type transport system permease protein
VTRTLSLLATQLRASTLIGLAYRWELLVDAVLSLFWTGTAVLPLYLVFEERTVVAGHTYPEALVVLSFFTILQAVLEGAIHPSLATVVDHVRTGTLDFVLLKPADAQLLLSTARFAPLRAVNLIAGIAIAVHAFDRLGRVPAALDLALGLLLLLGAVVILYSLWILVVSASFYAVRVDNLRFLFVSIFDAARWPSSVYRGAMGFVLTYVIPLALMTTIPAHALLGIVAAQTVAATLVGTAVFAAVSRWVFLRSLARYTSASS